MKIISADSSPLIAAGEHLAKITKAFMVEAEGNGLYKDKTQQLAVVFESDGKQITRWFNLKGYQVDEKKPEIKDDEGRTIPNYLTDAKGSRIEDEANTAACLKILGQLAHDTGIAEGDEIDVSDLEGKEVGINVSRNDTGFGSRLRVSYTLPADRVKAGATAEVFA